MVWRRCNLEGIVSDRNSDFRGPSMFEKIRGSPFSRFTDLNNFAGIDYSRDPNTRGVQILRN